ncbi:MAG TPA: NYN domain-containing protein [Pyrinomonadaceae bacterium]|nr:NYN domain-containing protein [Pyrinomonadaceae bacterium]
MTTYLFIDGGYLRTNYVKSIRPWFGCDGEIDFESLRGRLRTGDLERCFYYDALEDEPRTGETSELFKSRVEHDEAFFTKIEDLDGYFVRLGSLTGGRNRRQKKVDILLAVEALDHAVRRNMDRAILLTGDRDFEPLVTSLVQLGIHVEVAGDRTTTSRYLRRAADAYRPLSFQDYYKWTVESVRETAPLAVRPVGSNLQESDVFESGTFQGKKVELRRVRHTGMYYLHIEQFHDLQNHLTLELNEVERLKLYFRLQYGEIDWHHSKS